MSLSDVFRGVQSDLAPAAVQGPDPGMFDALAHMKDKAVEVEAGHVRPDGAFRGSKLPYFCAREAAIALLAAEGGGAVGIVAEDWRQHWKREKGTAMHAALQVCLGMAGQLKGQWKCRTCGRVSIDHIRDEHLAFQSYPEPATCNVCGAKGGFSYLEHHLTGLPERISGHLDGVLPDEKALLEIKTCEENRYRGVVAHGPPPLHKVQGGVYLMMAREAWPFVGFDRVRFLYAPQFDASDFRHEPPDRRKVPYALEPGTGMIYFDVPMEDMAPHAEKMLGRVREFRAWANASLRAPIPPRLRECASPESAGKWRWGCPWAAACFEGWPDA